MSDGDEELVGLLLSRIGQEFDGECHLTEAEARQIATLIAQLRNRVERRDAEILRLVDALVIAHYAGVQWPSDPLPFGSLAHNLFIERGNDPERIAALNRRA
jgi:hypothetical protein